jgi:hypothetical protein
MRASCPVLQQKNRELDHSLTCTTTQRPLLSLTVVSLTELAVEYRVIHTQSSRQGLRAPVSLRGGFGAAPYQKPLVMPKTASTVVVEL